MVPLTLSERGAIELRLLEIAMVLDDMKRHRVWDLQNGPGQSARKDRRLPLIGRIERCSGSRETAPIPRCHRQAHAPACPALE